jgi:regulatory protein
MSDTDPLDELALRYVAKYAVPSSGLKRYLQRKMRDAQRKTGQSIIGEEADALRRRIDAVVARFQEKGWINDEAWTERKVEVAVARGRSRRATQAMLASKGVDRTIAAAATADWDQDQELAAARQIVRRRKLGHWRPAHERADRRQKDLAVLARAGFPGNIARRALEVPDDEEEEDE